MGKWGCFRHKKRRLEQCAKVALYLYFAKQNARMTQNISPVSSVGSALIDLRGRPLRDLRISVTDRCNFRCSYCMPKHHFGVDYVYLPQSALLTFEEISRLARQFVACGVQKIRLTGGEPLLRRDLEKLVAQLAALRTSEGQPVELALTTNGALLARKAQALKDAGLQRVTVSLDGLNDSVFRQMNDVDFPVTEVLAGIEAAQKTGFQNIKVNMVVKRGANDQEIVPMANYFRGTGITLRFIEYMDVGQTNGWHLDAVLPSAQVLDRLQEAMPLLPLDARAPGETASRWGYANASGMYDPNLGEIGLISSVTQPFCRDCSRARLSTEGKLFTCLFSGRGHDLRGLIRGNPPVTDLELQQAIAAIWCGREDRYSELRDNLAPIAPRFGYARVEMSYIGG